MSSSAARDTYQLCFPATFREETVPPDLMRHTDKIKYVFHAILWQQISKTYGSTGISVSEPVPLRAAYLQGMIGRRYRRILGWMLAEGHIESTLSYVPGEHSREYGWGARHSGAEVISTPVRDRQLRRNMEARCSRRQGETYEKARRNRIVRVLEHLMRQFSHLEMVPFDLDLLLEKNKEELREKHDARKEKGEVQGDFCFEDTARMISAQVDAVRERIWEREWVFTYCDYHRFHSPLTRLWHRTREYLRWEGEPLVNLDIKSSQPLFLYFLLRDSLLEPQSCNSSSSIESHSDPYPLIDPYDTPFLYYDSRYHTHPSETAHKQADYEDLEEEVNAFGAVLLDGDIYTLLTEKVGLGDSREIGKESFFHVVYGTGYMRTPYHEAMESLFPQIMAEIAKLKKQDGYKSIAQGMQIAEGDFILGTVVKRLRRDFRSIPVFTIHDSLMTTPEHSQTVREIMESEFREEFGVVPEIRTETP